MLFLKKNIAVHLHRMKKENLNEIALRAFAELEEVIAEKRPEIKGSSLAMARAAAAGKVYASGQKNNLGIDRVINLINQYAPDHFDIQITITKK